MAYFLGRDVSVCVSTENVSHIIDNNAGVASVIVVGSVDPATDIVDRTDVNVTTGVGKINDVTGVDISLGSVDEDIAYMGQRTALKAEVKKETTLTVTKKKTDGFYSSIFALGLRYGTADDTDITASQALGTTQPGVDHGFRLFLALKDTLEVITIPGCTMTEYSVSLTADGVQEETISFVSHITPLVQGTEDTSTVIALGSGIFQL